MDVLTQSLVPKIVLFIQLLSFATVITFQGDGCKNYGVLSEADRAQGNTVNNSLCDRDLVPGWYRFQRAAGDRMPDGCVPEYRCGTESPGWLNGTHPTVAGVVVKSKVCYHRWGDCCWRSNNIQVKNCGSFYVYELQKPPNCSLRYCGNAVLDIDECASNPCVNGDCIDGVKQYIDECASSPCLNGGICFLNEVNQFSCNCIPGFTGVQCETNIDECASNPCVHGDCVDGLNQFTCNCHPGYTGVHCENDIDECASSPCLNGGVCVNEVNKFSCNCIPGFTGVQCETNIDECASNPCVNGDCIDGVNQYTCNCYDGSTGEQCGFDEQGVTLSASHLLVNVSGKFVINCTVYGGPNDLIITWFKAGTVIGLSHRTKVETGLRHSRLTVRDVMAEDQGNYTCQAIKGKQMDKVDIFIEVNPILEIKPRTVTKRVGDKVTFTCGVVSGFRKGASIFLIEATNKDNEVRHQEMNFTATNLQIPEGGESHVRKFVCEMTTQQNVLSRSEVAELVIIKPEAPKCPKELLEGVIWSATAAGRTDVKPCPKGASGTASRICSGDVTWKYANFVGCSSAEFLRLGDEIEAITEGFQSNTTAQQVLPELVNVTQPVPENDTKRPPEIFGGDLVIAVKILVTLADFNAKQGNVSTEEDTKNFAQVASNLLESTNRITWQQLEKLNQSQGQSLVKAMDDYGLGAAATFTGSTESRVVQTKNLAMRIDRANNNSLLRDKGLTVTYNQSSIQLPSEAFRSSPDSRVVTLVYLTFNDVLPLRQESNDDDDEHALSANTTIVSSTIDPRPPAVLKKPVKIVLQNRRVNDPAGVTSRVTPQAKCVFWRPGEAAIWQTSGCRLIPSESDVNKTTCECDHLTIFASLMDPYDAPIGEAHTKALEIISIVGCSISLLAVLITIAVTLFFWRAVKSPRSKVLLNLCAAVAVFCILVIFEGSARDNKVGCTILAALLHYFLLALFCWMLCEGVLHYFLIVKVFGGEAADKVKYFYIFGWGFPIIVVSISLGALSSGWLRFFKSLLA
ncbi:hypothetical protein ACROYT_G008996 [Oculina patagonica]